MCWCGSFFFFKQKTAYEMRISDWSSDVCSSDLGAAGLGSGAGSGSGGGPGLRGAEEPRLGRRAYRQWAAPLGRKLALRPHGEPARPSPRYSRHAVGGGLQPRRRLALPGARLREPPQSVTEIGRASCRERVCQYVSISVVAGSIKKK